MIWKSPILPSVAIIEPLKVNVLLAGSKWNKLELISILPLEALINWVVSEPIKNLSALISSSLGLVLNLKKLSLVATNSKPTPPSL